MQLKKGNNTPHHNKTRSRKATRSKTAFKK